MKNQATSKDIIQKCSFSWTGNFKLSLPTYSINSFLFPKGVLSVNCFSWGREHNSKIFMKKPLLFPSSNKNTINKGPVLTLFMVCICLFYNVASAQTWSANTGFGAWYCDSPPLTPDFSSSNSAISGTPMTGGSGVAMTIVQEGAPSFFRMANLNSTSFANAVTDDDYISSTVTIAPSNTTIYRFSQTTINGVSSISGGLYTLAVVVVDLTTNISTTVLQDLAIATTPLQVLNLPTPYEMGAGKSYEIRWYVYGSSFSNTVRGIDNPVITFQTASCNAGATAPTLTATIKSNVCPATTADISSLVSSTCPVGSSLEWHNVSTGFSAANKVADATTVGAGTYYPVCFDATNTCYSPAPATGVTVSITTCLSITQPTAQSGLQNVAKSGTVPADVSPTGGVGTLTYSNGSADPACIAPSGATALPGASNLVINANGSYSYTTPSTVGTYYFCVKVCDSTTPTPDCKVAIYQVVVMPPPCNVGNTAPRIN